MAQPQPKRILELDLAGPLTLSDVIPIVQGTVTKRTPLSGLPGLLDDGCECTLVSRYTTVGTDANTLKKYLHTYSVPADLITVDGSYLEIHAAGLFAANGNTKRAAIELKQNSTGLSVTFPIPPFAFNDDYWLMDLRLQRSGDSTYMSSFYGSVVDNSATLQTPGVLHYTGDGTGTEWDNGDLQICITAQNGTANANDVTCNTFIVEAHLLDPNS